MANGAKIYSGTYIPTADTVAFSIDTGATNWSHFMLVAHTLPYGDGIVTQKAFVSEYVDFEQGYCINTHGGTTSATSPTQVSFFNSEHSYFPQKNATVIGRSGSFGYHGTLFANVQYDWYAW